ncbi:MAG: twin-arginine translocation signal domain-containing protein [Chloroflexota bacterium]
MGDLSTTLSRRRFLQTAAGAAAAAAAGSAIIPASPSRNRRAYGHLQLAPPGATTPTPSSSRRSRPASGCFPQHHGVRRQRRGVHQAQGGGRPARHGVRRRAVGAQVPRGGLIDAWDINALAVSKQLYPLAREFEIWTTPEGYLGFPFGWSPVQDATTTRPT